MNQSYQNNHGQNQEPPRFNPYYLEKGYFTDDSKKQIRRELLIEEAEKIAKLLAQQNKLTSTTLRRFYNKLRNAHDQYRANGDFQAIVNKIQELEPQAVNVVQRNVASYPFQKFIQVNARLAAQNPDNLKAFVRHYQSIICYFPENNNR